MLTFKRSRNSSYDRSVSRVFLRHGSVGHTSIIVFLSGEREREKKRENPLYISLTQSIRTSSVRHCSREKHHPNIPNCERLPCSQCRAHTVPPRTCGTATPAGGLRLLPRTIDWYPVASYHPVLEPSRCRC